MTSNWSASPIARAHEIPHLTKTPWELDRNKRNSIWRRTKLEHENVFPTHFFKKLPREVYDCIVGQLEQLHFESDQSCPSCYLRDMHSLMLTSRAWDRAATLQMYRKVWVLTNDEHPKMPKLKIKGTGRLKLLRRTLRERQTLARYVKELRVPEFQSLHQDASIEREEIVNLIASIVMSCPNLERLVGFHVPYMYTFDRLSHALSTRKELKERVWLLKENDIDSEDEDEELSNNYYHRANDPTECFLDLNSSHTSLTTLVLHQQQPLSSPLTFRAIIGALRQLPSLRSLSISNLPSATFPNLALNALPPNLQHLRLENLPGINDKGLQRFASSHLTTSLKSLTLINLEISNLLTIAGFLSTRVEQLQRFSLSQHKTPRIPVNTSIPILHSTTLEYVHWEIRSQAETPPMRNSAFASRNASSPSFPFPESEPTSCLATCLLSVSIKNGLFPALRKIRAPHDPQGLLQSLCKPRATALLPSDTALLTSPPRSTTPSPSRLSSFDPLSSYMFPEIAGEVKSHAGSSLDTRADSPMSAGFPSSTNSRTSSDASLSTAITPAYSRLAAQARILEARKQPFMTVKVTDPKGEVRVSRPIFGFLGQLDSKIVYEVKPDRQRLMSMEEREGEREWITGIGDVVGEWEEVGGLVACRHLRQRTHRVVEAMEMF
ncbi:hypothetical protein BDV96DRAFT_498801 [Lophiotrema nucula]|uniref:F-box domain-containing protein n=1 Tax=Lophiotrema nucula TaxID=690887 RepID=A0A6A5Z022_9PLEO|nr:hypothetical protein BDV96DRAFT_498801 [Lophiotrema nucula]